LVKKSEDLENPWPTTFYLPHLSHLLHMDTLGVQLAVSVLFSQETNGLLTSELAL
jgi:hypothetical protein